MGNKLIRGLSSDTKPTVPDGYSFYETDTTSEYLRVSGAWVQIDGTFSTGSPLTVSGTAPEIRLAETDQTDPAGRYRMGVTADSFVLGRSQAAAFANALGSASDFNFLTYDRANSVLYLQAYESNSWYINLLAGAAATPGTNAAVVIQPHATAPYVDVKTGNAAGSLISRVKVGGGSGTPDMDISNVRVDLQGNAVVGLATIGGNGDANVNIKAYKLTTDATARRIIQYVLDPATDTEYSVSQAVPDAANPKFTMAAPDDAPSTSELDADHITFSYTKATDTLNVHVNEGGVIKTLAIGVLV